MHRSWSELSNPQRAVVVVGGAVEVVLTAIAARDLARRPASEVHGSKPLWALALMVQPVGPVAYLLTHRG